MKVHFILEMNLDYDFDVMAALNGDFDFDNPENQLEDDFVAFANAGAGGESAETSRVDQFRVNICEVKNIVVVKRIITSKYTAK